MSTIQPISTTTSATASNTPRQPTSTSTGPSTSTSTARSVQREWTELELEVAHILTQLWEMMQTREEALSPMTVSASSETVLNEAVEGMSGSDSDIDDSDDPEEPLTPVQEGSSAFPPDLVAPIQARSVESWRQEPLEGQYLDLGLEEGVYEAPPAIPGKVPFPEDKVPANGRTPPWVYLCYSVLARVPGGKMTLDSLFETCLEWCPARLNPDVSDPRDTAKRSASRSLSTNDRFFFSENKECWRLRDVGEVVVKFSGPARMIKVERGESSRRSTTSSSSGSLGPSTSTQASCPTGSWWTAINSRSNLRRDSRDMPNNCRDNGSAVSEKGKRKLASNSTEVDTPSLVNGRRRLPDGRPDTPSTMLSSEVMRDGQNGDSPPPKKRKSSSTTHSQPR
ncbi:uncharacterized protein BP5553_00615 [Venustampulla echinocandica]|uniref:Uncharacterized protein n=1 Tax=Venustampulla echinocandica TaxID=2656787 RepID=A0A370TYN1_9HELO|nr:uncharacterized protein BP5553_00615 [Venustampulla echinocandica]RDL40636.1 hypothetical protein BP5553_00615 [Venustampulla echinocandica]